MKKIKFILIALCLLTAIFVILLALRIERHFPAVASRYCDQVIVREISRLMNDRILQTYGDYDKDDILIIEKDGNGNITLIDIDTQYVNLIKSKLTLDIIEKLTEYRALDFGIPLGNALNSYAFSGLGAVGLEYLKTAREETGLPIVTELMDLSQLPLFKDVDVIQIGARNMQNYDLLKAVGRQDRPVMIKRGMCATYEEWLMSAEHVMAGGNKNVILCERGIRTFEPYTQNTLDLTASPVLKKLTHLPVIVDPSHASGRNWLVEPLARGAVAAGCDGLQIEVHHDPAHALCDGPQSLRPDAFATLTKHLQKLHTVIKTLED